MPGWPHPLEPWRPTLRPLADSLRSAAPLARRWLKAAIPFGLRQQARQGISWIGGRLSVRPRRSRIASSEALGPYSLGMFMQLRRLPLALDALGLDPESFVARPAGRTELQGDRVALLLEGPSPGAWRIPLHLRTMVPIRPLEAQLLTLEPELRRRLRRLREHAETRLVSAPEEVARVHRDLFAAFALDRHRDRTVQLTERSLQRLAAEGGVRLTLLDGEEVGAFAGYPYRLHGADHWAAARFGYPARIFGDPKRLSDANTINAQLALEFAASTVAADFDFGLSPACPEGGLLQFKRRRGGILSTSAAEACLWLRPPRADRARFLWRWPVFSVEEDGIVLHLGAPSDLAEGALEGRLHRLAYSGLAEVQLHSERPLLPQALEAARLLFSGAPGATHGKGQAGRVREVRELQ